MSLTLIEDEVFCLSNSPKTINWKKECENLTFLCTYSSFFSSNRRLQIHDRTCKTRRQFFDPKLVPCRTNSELMRTGHFCDSIWDLGSRPFWTLLLLSALLKDHSKFSGKKQSISTNHFDTSLQSPQVGALIPFCSWYWYAWQWVARRWRIWLGNCFAALAFFTSSGSSRSLWCLICFSQLSPPQCFLQTQNEKTYRPFILFSFLRSMKLGSIRHWPPFWQSHFPSLNMLGFSGSLDRSR